MTLPKDPNAELDYGFDWTEWLNGDTIAASAWSVPSGLTKETDSHTDTTATVWLSGGTAGRSYTVTNTITTAAGRTEERSLILYVAHR